MNAITSNFVDNAQLLFNASYIGFNSKIDDGGGIALKNVSYDTFLTDTMTKVNMSYDSTKDIYIGPTGIVDGSYTAIDEFNDSSVNTAIWTVTNTTQGPGASATTTEDTSDITLACTSGNGNAADFGQSIVELGGSGSNLMGDFNNYIRVKTTSVSSFVTESWARIIVTDGVNSQIVYNAASGDGIKTVDFFVLNNTLYYRVDSAAFSSISVSGWTQANMVFQIAAHADFFNSSARSITFKVNWARYFAFGTPPTASIASTAVVSGSVITNATMTHHEQGTNSPALQLSADNGANFEVVTDGSIHRFTNTGTQLIAKFVYTNYTAPFSVSEYAIKYNFY